MKTKLFLSILFLLSIAGIAKAQVKDSLDLEIVWQKEVFPKEIKFAYFSADGQWIYAAIGNTIEKISASSGEFISTFNTEGISHYIVDMDISSLGNLIVTLDDGAFVLWDISLEKAIKYLSYKIQPFGGGILGIAISPDEKYLFFSVSEYTSQTENNMYLVVYDIINDKEIKRIPYGYTPQKIKYSRDGKHFATGGWYEDKWSGKKYDQVILWSTETWAPVDTIETLEGVGSGYTYLKFSKDDKLFGSVRRTPGDARIYNLASKELLFNKNNCYNFEMLPDNNHFLFYLALSSSNYGLDFYNNHEKINSFHIPSGISDVFNINEIWKIFCCSTKSPIFYLTKKTTGVETKPSFYENIKITQKNNNIIIQTENVFEDSISIYICDLQGKIIFSQKFENNNPTNRIFVPVNLNSGIYLCKVLVADKEYSQKIEIVR